jgi:very-short-patch-repair endonuclease
MQQQIQQRLTGWRRSLIDLGRRNRLLNYRATRVTTVETEGADPASVYQHLFEGRKIRLVPRPEPDLLAALGADEDEAEADLGRELYADNLPGAQAAGSGKLQTTATASRLAANLLALSRKAEESLDEQGVNTLYLALGMVEWKNPADGKISKAPAILYPVALKRRSAADPFVLEAGDEEPVLNPALIEKLRELRIPFAEPTEASDEWDVDALFAHLSAAVGGLDGWGVTGETVLGLFSFQKYLMFKDLERHGERIGRHELVGRICTGPSGGAGTRQHGSLGAVDLDREMAPWSTIQVVDADSSQQLAILAVRKGENLVIEGPPGTGKSQTITNIIADAMAAGRTVLFVAEKRAALEVVQTRLEHDAGLADYILELHSSKASKKEFVSALARSLDNGHGAAANGHAELARLERLSAELARYVVDLHAPKAPMGRSPYEGIAELAAALDAPWIEAKIEEIEQQTAASVTAATEAIGELARTLPAVGVPARHSLRGIEVSYAGHEERRLLTAQVAAAGAAVATFVDAVDRAAELFGLRLPETMAEASLMLASARVVARTPGADVDVLSGSAWNMRPAAVDTILEAGRRQQQARPEMMRKFDARACEVELAPARSEYERLLGQGMLRFFTPRYWQLRSELKGFLQPQYRPGGDQGLIRDLAALANFRNDLLTLRMEQERALSLFGSRWKGAGSDWDDLDQFSAWATELRRCAMSEALDEKGIEIAAAAQLDPAASQAAIDRLDKAIRTAEEEVDALRGAGQMTAEADIGAGPACSIQKLAVRIAEIEGGLNELRAWSAYIASRKAALATIARHFIEAAMAADIQPGELSLAFRRLFWTKWIGALVRSRGALAQFHSAIHEERIEEFQDLDRKSRDIAKERAKAALCARRRALTSPELSGQVQVLQREARRRRGIKSVRRLLSETPLAIQTVKPCFMMSPISVAQYLDPERLQFDLVVFDEASQIQPADAIGSIFRAQQVVVVGDSKQLPPTNFFGTLGSEEDEDEEVERDLESILDEVATSGVPSIRLKWHYRSQHQSLIRFSNEEFYSDDPLYVFPSAVESADDLGLKYTYVPNGVYLGAGKNRIEAQAVAEAVRTHIMTQPHFSLGVGTFGKGQQDVIMDELDRLRRADPAIEWFFQQPGERKFFVKNLENIQGDDRDVIFLSVTYGPDAAGVVRRNFGPINQEGGWRRLNVLTTRAKRYMRVFSSMRSDQIDVGEVSQGAVLLRQYLHFAETGSYAGAKISAGAVESPFEASVKQALERRGYRVISQVGDAGYRIDLAIVNDDAPGSYLCGIECDGATYHSAQTVRDRDRLRQQVLELRGWTILRVWSTDWFHDPKQEIERLVGRIDAARTQQRMARTEAAPEPVLVNGDWREVADEPRAPGQTPLEEIEVEMYRAAAVVSRGTSEQFYTAPRVALAQAAMEIIAQEGPVHRSVIASYVASCWSLLRTGSQITAKVDLVLNTLLTTGQVAAEGDFFTVAGNGRPPVRSRAALAANNSIDLVCQAEITEAMRLLLRHRQPLLEPELITETARLLGFARTGARVRQRVEESMKQLSRSGGIRAGGTGMVLTE